MTSEVKRIQDQLERAFAGEAWHGPSVLELLANVNAGKAAARSIASAHSIWELVLHIAAWDKAVARRLAGDRAELSDEEDWPAVNDTSDEAWRQALETLQSVHRELYEAIGRLDDARLDQPIVEGMPSVYVTLHGVIQHDLYHAGQIAILKKA
jgi:uncharacterized damage-inducible protein DinB